jgi:hypothetical protein
MSRHALSCTFGLVVVVAAPCAHADEVPAPVPPSAPAIEPAPVVAPTPVVEAVPAPMPTPAVEAAPVEAPKPAAAPAPAGGFKAKGVEWKFSAVTYFNYGYTLAGEDAVKKLNSFSLDRAYVNIEPIIDEHWSARITPDLAKPDAAGRNYTLRLKFAYVDGKKLGGTGVGVRAGMLPTPATDAHDKAWGYRVLTRPTLDLNGVTPTSDLGASVGYTWGSGELRLFLTNGEGYEYIETTLGKDLTIHLTQELVTGLNLNVGAVYGTWLGGGSKFWHPEDTVTISEPDPMDPTKTVETQTKVKRNSHYDQRLVVPLMLTWEQGSLRAGLDTALIRRQHEDFDAVTGLSAALFVVPKIGEKMEIPVRIARFDPNMDGKTGKDDESINAVVGYSYNFAGMLKVIPNVQVDKKGKDKATVTGFVHLEGKL